MKRLILIISIINSISFFSYAQAPEETDIQSLLAIENYFSALSVEKGPRKAFLKASDEETILFRPDAVSAKKFYKKAKKDSAYLSWSPSYARVSKSGDWGFTSGPFIARPSKASANTIYGQYLSVWRRNIKGIWKLAIDAGITHSEPREEPRLDFASNSGRFFRQFSAARQQQRKEIILSTDKLFSITLKAIGANAYGEFASNDIHVLFPGEFPIIGKNEVITFFGKQDVRIISENAGADRSFGGDYAYTYGKSSITRRGKAEEFNYIRIWQLSKDHNWNVLFEVFSPTEKPIN